MSLETAFAEAVAECASAGVPVLYNDDAYCCRGCLPASENPTAVFFLSQFGSIEFVGGVACYVETEEADCQCEEAEYEEADDGSETLIRDEFICEVCCGYEGPLRVTTPIRTLFGYYTDLNSAALFVRTFQAHGLSVEWDGSRNSALELKFS